MLFLCAQQQQSKRLREKRKNLFISSSCSAFWSTTDDGELLNIISERGEKGRDRRVRKKEEI